MTNDRLQGKVAIITGGASGIGEACSRIFVREGAKVIISDIDASKGNALEAELAPNAVFFNHDVTQESAWDEAVEIAESKWGRLDIVVNNAGMSGPKGRTVVEDVVLDDWNDVFAVNSTAIMLGTRAGIKAMKKVGGGSIINVSSIFGIVGSRAGAPYHASKGAARIFSKAAAVQYGPRQHPRQRRLSRLHRHPHDHRHPRRQRDPRLPRRHDPHGPPRPPRRHRLRLSLPSLRRIRLGNRHRTSNRWRRNGLVGQHRHSGESRNPEGR